MTVRVRRAGPLGRTLAAAAVSSCFASPAALANPTGAQVVHGTAAIHQTGNLLQITNSPNAIINWQSFSIGANETTRFVQQSSSSAVLNRVTTQNPSTILGTLESNGRVFLINPNGILFGAGAQIDVAGLVASSLNLSNEDFLAGQLRFTEVPGAGSVVNQGNITTGAGGSVYLVGSSVTNSGIIRSPQGEVVLAAGNSVELVSPGTPDLRVEIAAADNEARNLGQIIAEAGRIGIYAGLINNSGTIRADSAVSEGGRILLKATKSATLEAGSVTSASGAAGGSVTVQSADTTLVSGTMEAAGAQGAGGRIEVLGHYVGLMDAAVVDASGTAGGGTVLVGGDFQGKNPEVQNAFRTYVGVDATIRADALASGDGGKVIVWSDDATRAYGTISARGGAHSGDGGFVEVSGKGALDFSARIDTRAPNGAIGTLLLDPANINVAAGGTATTAEVDAFLDAGANLTIAPAALEAAGATVVLQATNDITVNDAVNLTTPGAGFVAQAGRHIDINAPVSTAGGMIHLEADSPHQPGGADGVGLVTVGAAVNSNGGHITLIGGGNSNPQGGFKLDADVNAGTGGINVALSTGAADLDFFIGAGGNTQLSSSDTGSLKTTGALVLGQATSAGTDGLGLGSVLLTVNSITNATANPIQLSAESGSSFELVAGVGGITLDRPLTSFQDMVITTTGDLHVNQTLSTSNNDLTITAANVILGPNGSVNTGSGSVSCTAAAGCAAIGTVVIWDGGAGTLNWFDAGNWSGDVVPDSSKDVTVDTSRLGGGTVLVAGSAQAKSLNALTPMEMSSGSLTLENASTFSNSLTVSGGSLSSDTFVTVGGPSGALTWTGGSFDGAGGTFLLAGGQSATLSNSLSLNLLFQNSGTLALSGATVTGTGSITNFGTVTASGTNVVGRMLLAGGAVSGSGSLTVNDWSRSGGIFDMTGSAYLKVPSGDFSVDHAYSAGSLTLQAPAGDIVLNAAVSGTGASGTTVTLAAGNKFVNNVGAAAIDPGGGRFLVYSSDPASDTRGGLAYDFKQYDATFGSTTVLGAGDGFLYTVAPTITPTLSGTATKVYDGSLTAPLGALTLSGSGAIDGDTLTLAAAGATYDSRHVGTGKAITASGITFTASDDAATVYGYQLAGSTASAGIGEITPAPLTLNAVSDTKVYDGTRGSAGTPTTVGLVGGDTVGALGQLFVGKNVLGTDGSTLVVKGGYVVNDGNGGANYAVTTSTATGTITPAPVSLTASRTYDGTTDFAAGAFGTISGVNGETLALSGSGTVASPNVAAGSQALATGTLVLGNGTGRASNYTLSGGTHTGTVTPAVVSVSGTRAFDGTVDFTINAFGTVSGVNGETLTVAGGSGTVASEKVSAGTQTLATGTLALGNGTGLASNYTLAGGAHTGTITPGTSFTWTASGGGAWEAGANWNQGIAPVSGAIVTIPDVGAPGVSDTISYSRGTSSVKTVTSAETLTLAGGTLNLGTSAADISSIPVVNLDGGTLAGAGTLNLASLNLNGGLLTGSLLITANVSNQGGTVTPGASPGALTINGNYVQGPGGTLVVEIGGTTGGSQYDQLIVNGNATLGGTLSVTLVNGYVPAGGETFGVVQSSGAVGGTFASTNFPAIPTFTTAYLPAGVQLLASVPVPPGAVAAASQVVVALTDQNQNTLVASQLTGLPVDVLDQPQEREGTQKTPMCNASGSGDGGGGRGGGGGMRCNTRGCF